MQFPPHARLVAALVILTAGGAYATHLVATPIPLSAPDPEALRRLAAAVDPHPLAAPALGLIPDPPPPATPAPRPLPAPPAVARQAAPAAPPAPTPGRPLPTPLPPRSPVENLALMGVTQTGSTREAWLVHLETLEREVVPAGGSAWGLAVREVGSEHVRLAARGGDEFLLRLGEKRLPTREAPPPAAQAAAPTMTRLGDRQRGGGGNRSWNPARQRTPEVRTDARSWNRDSGRERNRRRESSSTPTNLGLSPRMLFGPGSGNTGPTTLLRPTPNAQKARRTGAQFLGGGQPLRGPEPITNPQTQRRLGGNSTAAFGTANPSGRGVQTGGRAQPQARR